MLQGFAAVHKRLSSGGVLTGLMVRETRLVMFEIRPEINRTVSKKTKKKI